MLLSYVKIPATHYALHYQQGLIRHEGPGLSFFYYSPSATIVSVPLGSTDAPFAFQESTADFQAVTVQGQLTYRVADPKKVAGQLDFSLGRNGQYLADGLEKLQERLVKSAQVAARAVTQRMTLPEVLTSATAIGAEVADALKNSELIAGLGVEILDLAVISVSRRRRWPRLLRRKQERRCSANRMKLFTHAEMPLLSKNAVSRKAS